MVCSSRFNTKIPTNKKNIRGSSNLGTTGLEGTALEKMQNIETRGDFLRDKLNLFAVDFS